MSSMEEVRRISIIIPMYNEAARVEQLVGDIAEQDFPGEVEVLVADGGSTDGSVELLTASAERLGVHVVVIENPERFVSSGLNACIRRAVGDLIVRLDCHTRYPAGYLRLLARAAEETGACNVGGLVVPTGRTAMERAVACAMDSAFGGIGWTRAASSADRTETDTVTYGAFRPAAFKRAGLFDETLIRNQDDELNFRLRQAGGRIVLDPAISVGYTPRSSLSRVVGQYFEYGLWKVPVMLKHRRVLSARSLAPVGMVGSLMMLGSLAPVSTRARQLLAAETALYVLLALAFGVETVRRRKEPWSLLPRVVSAYPAFHVGYGLGMARGWVRAFGRLLESRHRAGA
jgi:succinoglycan biosynthesis protein ExoA